MGSDDLFKKRKARKLWDISRKKRTRELYKRVLIVCEGQKTETFGTWERLADVVYKGGAKSLKAKGIQAVGTEKTSWAKNIGNYLEVTKNKSPSFMFFVNCIREYLKVGMA